MGSSHHDKSQVMTPLLSIDRLNKTFGGTRVLRDVSLEVKAGEVHAVIGANGSGKSTLIKILAGFHAADPGGTIAAHGQRMPEPLSSEASKAAGMRFVHQDAPLVDTMSIADNIALEEGFITGLGNRIRGKAQRRHATEIMERFGIRTHPDTLVQELSAPDRMKLAIAREDQSEGWRDRLLVLDEPTAALPADEAERLFEYVRSVKEEGGSILYVSHRLAEVTLLADRVTVLRDGRLVGTFEADELDEDEMVRLMIGQAPSQLYTAPPHGGGNVQVEVSELRGKTLSGLSFAAHEGEILGFYGLVGCGKSELGRILAGAQARSGGEVRLDGREVRFESPHAAIEAGMGYVPEDRQSAGIVPTMSIRENMTLANLGSAVRFGRLWPGIERREVKQLVTQFGVVPPDPERAIVQLSGGNQQKVLLARALRCEPQVLVADEPTAGVDINAKHQIYELIRQAALKGTTVIILSAEAQEIASVCDRAIVLREGHAVAELGGEALTEDAVVAASFGRGRQANSSKPSSISQSGGNS